MAPESRRTKIEAMLAEEPGDVFLRYSLALELDKEGVHEASLARLRELMAEEQPYVPAFFMAGQQFVRLGRNDEARAALRAGIDVARRQADHHAAGEMSELLASLGRLGESSP
jgi:predicted RNA polymerase sigma factor